MYRFKNLLVGPGLSGGDKTLMRYAGMLSRITDAEDVHFLHAFESLEIPEDIIRKYLEFQVLEPSTRNERLEEAVHRHYDGGGSIRMRFESREGVPSDEFLSYIMEHEVDLAIVGKAAGDKHELKLAERLARKAPCSVMCVPPESKPAISRILVGVDFSDHSRDAMDAAVALAKAAGTGEILCLNVYQVPLRFTKTGRLFEEYGAIARQNAEAASEEFLKKIDLQGVSVDALIKLGDFPSEVIQDTVNKEEVDLLIVGARGRSAGAAVLLGSATEQLIRMTDCPLLAVKRKGEGLGLLKALLGA